MSNSPEGFERLGSFYLGREISPDRPDVAGELLLYDSKDLVTHGVVLGMTGSGKTGLCLALLEEAAMDGVPAIVIDPKGDISNLLLAFPDLAPGDFQPWIQPEEAARKEMTIEALAEKTAATWKKGLGDWGQGPERVRAFREKCEVTLFTPGSTAGIPVSILSSLEVPPAEVMEDGEALGERIESTVASLLSLVGVNGDPMQSPEAVFLGTLFQHEWSAGHAVTLESLVRIAQKPTFDKVGILDVDSFLSAKDRQALALKFNNLLAAPGFASWLEGPALDIRTMLHDGLGKPRISIFSISHLGDAERMFFVSLLLNQIVAWMRAQQGTTSLRALFYMDEIFGFLPPSANPPSKKPMMTLLKQSRAFGLGCLLATQNPVDLDYKALSNIGTWFLGRLQTERDKLRVLDGLEGAAGGGAFNRGELEKLLSGLGNRVFLMNNVHEDAPVLFQVRWVMSYLAGPLSRSQIKLLMDPRRDAWMKRVVGTKEPANPMGMRGPSTVSPALRPAVGAGVIERFAVAQQVGEGITYQPYLLRAGTVHFSSNKMAVEGRRSVKSAYPVADQGIDWEHSVDVPERLEAGPLAGIAFAELPAYAMSVANYRSAEKEFADWLYREQRAEIAVCRELGQYGQFDENERDFRARLAHAAREARDEAVAKFRDELGKKLKTLESRLQTAEGQVVREKAQANAAKMQAGASLLGGLLGGLLGRKSGLGSLTRATSTVGRASQAYKQHQDVAAADAKVLSIQEEIEGLRKDGEAELEEIRASFEIEALTVEWETIKPTRTGVVVDEVALLWLPFTREGKPAW